MTIPERIGRYHVVGHLATGGMAEILLGKLLGPGGFERVVVLKRALPHLARQREFRDMFLDEARVVARIRHPNVVHVTELGEEGSELFMVMEYLAGESVSGLLRRLLASGEWLPPDVAAHLVAEALAGLHAAHELEGSDGAPLGLVHRDISPQNLFVAYDGRIKVLDFGIAKFRDRSVETSVGHLKGKFAYMSPEQCRAEPVDRRSDVFSAAIVLWELLTATRLFHRGNELMTWKAIVEEDTPLPSQKLRKGLEAPPEQLARVVMRALSKDRDERPASAERFRKELVGVLREIDPEDRAGERLGAIMNRLFADRIAEKRELLRRVHSGDEVTSVPAAEVDVVVGEQTPSRESFAEISSIAPRAPRSRAPLVIAAGVAAVFMLGLTAFAFWPGDHAPDALATAEPPRTSTASPPSASSGPAAVGVPTADEPTASPGSSSTDSAGREPAPAVPLRVSLEFLTTPPGAELRRTDDDAVLGTTPCTVELDTSTEAIEMELVMGGYRTHVEHIVPDVNQRVRITLTRERRPRGSRSESAADPSGSPSSEHGGFFRFD